MSFKARIKNKIKQYLLPVIQNQVEASLEQKLAVLPSQVNASVEQRLAQIPPPVVDLNPVENLINGKIAEQLSGIKPAEIKEEPPFDLIVSVAARNIAASGDHRVVLPTDGSRLNKKPENIRIGFFGNIANNAYNFVKCLHRLGCNAELIVEDDFFDYFLLNRPFWEDVPVECSSYEEGAGYEPLWTQPAYVRRVVYDSEMQAKYQQRYSAIPEVQELYRQAFGIELAPDRALLLAQFMGHWPFLLAMQAYDIVQFSGAAILMGAFCPRPYVVFPTGSDLFISPFEESLFGLMMRAGYRGARHILVAETNYPSYLDRFAAQVPRTFCPLMMDTDTYCPGNGEEIKKRWTGLSGGERFLLNVCRQSWEWKGNDRLIRAFARFAGDGPVNWRLVLMEWGPDVEKSKKLIAELNIEDLVIWEGLSSKPLLRRKQQAADAVADQFVMEGYGTSVLESMAAGKAIIINGEVAHENGLIDPPPFLKANSEADIYRILTMPEFEQSLNAAGLESLDWTLRNHGYKSLYEKYLDIYFAQSV